jgi:DNA-directed RNA polymerase specialized sigma24 family protein
VLDSTRDVVRCLITYTDWWQPSSGSILLVGGARRDKNLRDGLNPGVVETLEERVELSRRMQSLSEDDRRLLFLWYVRQLHVDEIARALNLSRRQCFRRKAKGIQMIIDLGESDAAA